MKDTEQIVNEVYRSWSASQYDALASQYDTLAPVIRAMLREAVREAREGLGRPLTLREQVRLDIKEGVYAPRVSADAPLSHREEYLETYDRLWHDPDSEDK